MAREVDLIKEKLDLVEFLRSHLKLLPAGKNFKALCPFHQEKTPSFVVSPERKIWHCFGCGEGGDLVSFVMKYENLEFPETLRFLAEKAGITLRSVNPQEQKQFGILYDLHSVAKDFFKIELSKNGRAKEYLQKRGLSQNTIEEFDLGFAPGGESLTLHLMNKRYDVADIVRAGLAQKNVNGLYRDKFHGRIIFPIASHVGKTVAFTGRLLPSFAKATEGRPTSSTRSDIPKYLNSPETPIFNKSRILYGLDRSKNEIAKSRTVFLVEGQTDFLLAWQSGVKNVVAVSGTGLTREHLDRLKRLADTVVMSFDNDEAGFSALERSLDLFNNFDFHVKVVDLGSFEDPAEAVQADPGFLPRAIQKAKPAFSCLFEYHFSSRQAQDKQNDIAHRKRVLKGLLVKIKNIKSAVEQDAWVKELARVSGVSEPALLSELAETSSSVSDAVMPEEEAPAGPFSRIDLIAARLVSLAFVRKEFFSDLQSHEELLPDRYRMVIQDPESTHAHMAEMQSSHKFGGEDPGTLREEFDDLVRHLKVESLRREMEGLRGDIRLAQDKGDEQNLTDVMARFNVLAKKMNELR